MKNIQELLWKFDKIFSPHKGNYVAKFYNAHGKILDRTAINKVFWEFRDKDNPITPHTLRHYFCSSTLEAGYTIAEVAMLAGHSNIHTTMKYTNPSMKKIKERAEFL